MIKLKLCMVGLFGVGKTSLVKRYVSSLFDERYQTTIGVKIDKKDVNVNGVPVSLAIWDIAGEDDIAQARISHLRGASGYILVVDGLRRASLDKALDLHQRIRDLLGELPFVLVVNKVDRRDEWEIAPADLDALRDQGWLLTESSAKTGDGVESLFQTLAAKMLSRMAPTEDDDDE
jgi:small GTP-binding protein